MSARAVPVLGLLARPGEGEPLRPLIRALAGRCTVRALLPGQARPDALLASSPGALANRGVDQIGTSVFVADDDAWTQLDARHDPSVIVLTPSASIATQARRSGHDVVQVASAWSSGRSAPPRWPLVRERWRRRADLPDHLVLVIDAASAPRVAPDARSGRPDAVEILTVSADDPRLDDLVAVASAIVCDSSDWVDPPAWVGNGLVIDRAEDDLDADGALERALALAANVHEASRRVADATLSDRLGSADLAARSLLARLGIDPAPRSMADRVDARLGALHIPSPSPFRVRLETAFAAFTDPPLATSSSIAPSRTSS